MPQGFGSPTLTNEENVTYERGAHTFLTEDGRVFAVWFGFDAEVNYVFNALFVREYDAEGNPLGDPVELAVSIDDYVNGVCALELQNGDLAIQVSYDNGTSKYGETYLFDSEWNSLPVTLDTSHGDIVQLANGSLAQVSPGAYVDMFDASYSFLSTFDASDVYQSPSYTTEMFADLTALSNGGFVVAYTRGNSYTTQGPIGLYFQILDSNGQKVASEVRFSDIYYDYNTYLDVDSVITVFGLEGGNFVTAWLGEIPGSTTGEIGLYSSVFTSAGAALASEVLVSSHELSPSIFLGGSNPKITGTPDGGYVLSWLSFNENDEETLNAQRFDSTGQAIESQIELFYPGVNSANFNYTYDVEVTEANTLVFTYQGFGQVWGDWSDVYMQSQKLTSCGTMQSDTQSGTKYVDHLQALAGHDTVHAGAGRDLVWGGGGDDQLFGQTGNDRLWGGLGADFLHGGEGRDRAMYDDSAAGLTVDMQAVFNSTGIATGDTFYKVEDLSGSRFDDDLRGNARNNMIWGNNGNDTLSGRNGQDRLKGGNGEDVLRGGNGKDWLYGDSGSDQLIGQNGNDLLWGGSGADEFHFGRRSGNDEILDFQDGVDHIVFTRYEFSDLSIREDGADTLIEFGRGDSVLIVGQDAAQVTADDFLFL